MTAGLLGRRVGVSVGGSATAVGAGRVSRACWACREAFSAAATPATRAVCASAAASVLALRSSSCCRLVSVITCSSKPRLWSPVVDSAARIAWYNCSAMRSATASSSGCPSSARRTISVVRLLAKRILSSARAAGFNVNARRKSSAASLMGYSGEPGKLPAETLAAPPPAANRRTATNAARTRPRASFVCRRGQPRRVRALRSSPSLAT